LNDTRRAIVLIILCMTLLTLMDAITKVLIEQYSAFQIALLRYLVTLPAAYGLAVREQRRWLPWPQALGLQCLRCLVITLELTIVIIAFGMMPLADVHALIAGTPIFVAAMSMPLLGEQVSRRGWLAILVGFAGVLILLRPGVQVAELGTWLALGAAGLYATFQVLTRLSARFDGKGVTFFFQILLGIALIAIPAVGSWVPPTLPDWPLFVAVGLLGGTAHFLLIMAFSMAPAATLQPFGYTQLLLAVILGYLVFGDVPDLFVLVGGALVVLAGLDTFVLAKRLRDAPG